MKYWLLLVLITVWAYQTMLLEDEVTKQRREIKELNKAVGELQKTTYNFIYGGMK